MAVLDSKDHAFFEENGYVVVPNAVPQENLDAVVDAIWEFLGMDRNDPNDWYREPAQPSSMVEMYQHPAMWANRQYSRVYEAFTELFGRHDLWVSMDRTSMKPPANPAFPDYYHKGFTHWDTDTSQLPQPFGVQGVLYLTDTTVDMGGFQCIPGFHRGLEEWIKTQPPDRNPKVPDLTGLTVVPIPGKAGDLLIWNKLLAHGNGHNTSNRPRLAQYISMYPARNENEEARQERIRLWRERVPPKAHWVTGDPRNHEALHGTTADLSPLGRKLLGLDLWDDEDVRFST